MWHFRQSNNLLVFCGLVLCAGFMLQFKVLYNNHQKYLRIQEIENRMTELANDIKLVEDVANTTYVLFSKLEKTFKYRNFKSKMKPIR